MPLAAPVTSATRRSSSLPGWASVSLYSSIGQYSTSNVSWTSRERYSPIPCAARSTPMVW